MFRIIGDYSPAILIPHILDFFEAVWVHPWLERRLILFIYRMFLCHVFHLEYALYVLESAWVSLCAAASSEPVRREGGDAGSQVGKGDGVIVLRDKWWDLSPGV